MTTAKPSYPSGTVTFLFSDIEGSTRLWEHDAAAMRPALERHDAIMRAAIEERRGIVFKTVGDAFCAAFSQADDALAAAVNAQHALSDHPWAAEIGRLRVRMGIHTGTVVESDGDYFGPTVNRVARLMSIGYGEQILVSNATASLLRDTTPAGVTLRDLGTHRLKDLREPEATFQVVAAGLRTDFPALKSLDSRPNNLPFQIASFVGREGDLRDTRDAVSRHRLVTIAGPGGIGKTRLALQAAGEALEHFGDGAWLVPLSSILRPELIPQATAAVLRVREQPPVSIDETLAHDLAGKQLLLIIDSAEHLIPATAAFVKMLLNRCASLRVLVTSREPLHVTGEHVVRVGALDRAVELFVDRAREVAPDLAFGERELAVAGAVCRRLDNIPLAIELAAARIATIPLAELETRLSKGLSLLVSRDPTKEERHRTLRATISWSHALLDATDDAVFRCLGVFEGSFGIGALADIAATGEERVFDAMEALVGKSLASIETVAQESRFLVLDTVREYLVEAATQSGRMSDLKRRHFDYYWRVVEPQRAGSANPINAAWLEGVATEMSNVRAALDWGIRERPEDAAAFVCALSSFWRTRSHITEGRTWFRRFLAGADLHGAARAAILRRAATFATEQDAYEEALELSEEARALYERAHDVGGLAEALHNLAVIEQRRGNLDPAAAHYAAAIARFREAGHSYGEAVALLNLVLLSLSREDLTEADRYVDEAVAAAAHTDNVDLRAYIANFRGEIALRRGDLDGAVQLMGEALAVKRAIGNRYDVADVQNSLSVAYLRQGRLAEARAAAAETLRIAVDLNASSLAIFGFEAFCEIAIREERYEDAASYYGLANALRIAHSYKPTMRKMDEHERLLRTRLKGDFARIVARCASTNWLASAETLARSAVAFEAT